MNTADLQIQIHNYELEVYMLRSELRDVKAQTQYANQKCNSLEKETRTLKKELWQTNNVISLQSEKLKKVSGKARFSTVAIFVILVLLFYLFAQIIR